MTQELNIHSSQLKPFLNHLKLFGFIEVEKIDTNNGSKTQSSVKGYYLINYYNQNKIKWD